MNSRLTKARIKKFMSYYQPFRRIFALDMLFALAASAAALAFPLVSGHVTGVVLSQGRQAGLRQLLLYGLLMLALVAVYVVGSVLNAYFGHAMGAKMEGEMRQELFRQYTGLSFSFHSRESVGRLMTIMTNDLNDMTELFHHGPEEVLMTLVKFVGSFVVLAQIHLPLTLILFTAFPVLCLAAYKTNKIMEQGLARARNDLSQMNAVLEDSLAGIRTVKAFGAEAQEARRFEACNRAYVDSRSHFFKVEALFYETLRGFPQFLSMLVVFFGALFIGRGAISLPVLVTFLLYAGMIAEPVRTLMNIVKMVQAGKVSFMRFMDMLERRPEVQEAKKPVGLAAPRGEIVLEDVAFRYNEGAENVLEHLSLRIGAGQSVALVGASGIGKTTVASLIARFYDVSSGRITIDGVDVRSISFASLRESIGVVQQEVFIFNGTIRENILYGRPGATEQELRRAARLANAEEFIEKLPQGYNTVVGTRGITLSGGQRQRISLARVFLKNPPILILDEATSSLDYESELLVQASVNRLMKNRTSIVIAHRLSTIKNVNSIAVLNGKNVAEQGSHEELTAMGGEYARLCRMGNA